MTSASDYLTQYFNKVNAQTYGNLHQSNTNNSNLTPADAGFVGFTGFRANANSFQVVDTRGNSAFISGNQAAQYGLVNAQGLDFTGVQRFLPQNITGPISPPYTPSTVNNALNPQATSPNPTTETTKGSGVTNNSLTDSFNSGIHNVESFFTSHPLGLVAILGLGLVVLFKK